LWDIIHQRALLIREPNEVRILRVVRDSGEISRIEIAKATNLHKATISDLVAKLIRGGFLVETGEVEASKKVGRKRILLRFNPLAGLVAGVDIGMTQATVALTDLNARIVRQRSFNYSLDTAAKAVISRVAAVIQALLKPVSSPASKLVGIGIGVQGVVDCRTNTLVLSHNKKKWQGLSLSADLETKFDVPVYVENDVKTMALGEYLLGAAKDTRDFVHIWVGDGIGAGIMINGHLLQGITFSAGEIGYNGLEASTHYSEKYPLTYSNQVMFGEILTDSNLVEGYRRNVSKPVPQDLSVAAVARRSKDGDPVARQVIEEFTSLLSSLCIMMVNTLNPELILIGGKLAQSYPEIAGMLQDKIRRDLLTTPAEAVRVLAAKHGESGVILGAVGLVLYELFEPLHRVSVRKMRVEKFEIPRESDTDD
jgi:N-acetylglucosamine repressor